MRLGPATIVSPSGIAGDRNGRIVGTPTGPLVVLRSVLLIDRPNATQCPEALVPLARAAGRWSALTASVTVALALVSGGCSESKPAVAPVAPVAAARGAMFGKANGFNVLVVTFDTVRSDAIGCYGDPRARTPNVDALAAEGVRFARAIAPAPTTLPSHSTIFTGLDPLTHGVHNNGTFKLGEERTTLAELLGARGYQTAAVIGAFVLEARYGLAQGFASYEDELQLDGAAKGAAHFIERDAKTVTDRALQWLEQRKTAEPFFLWTHYFDAHMPYTAPLEYLRGERRPANAAYDAEAVRREYLAEVSYADAQLGRLLEALGPVALARTLVVFTADHGEGLGEHGEYTHSRLIYEGSLRVPLILSNATLFPGANAVSDRVVGLVDIVPSVLELLGQDAPAGLDGQSVFQVAPDPARAIYSESYVTLFNHGWAPLHALTRLQDKLILAPRSEYYDLKTDAGENRNLFGPTQPQSAQLARALQARLAKVRPLERSTEASLEADDERWLAQLGYSRTAPPAEVGKLDPKDMIATWAVLTNASTAVSNGQIDAALADVARVLERNPDDPFAWEVAYTAHWARNDLAKSEECLRRMLELNPTPEAYARLATVLFRQARYDDSLALVDGALRAAPDHGELLMGRGDALQLLGRKEEARAAYERALVADPARVGAAARRCLDSLGPPPGR